MYRDFILRKLSPDESRGLFVAPNLPGSKLGRILGAETSIRPGDVIAFYIDAGLFSTNYFIITNTKCHYPGGNFPFENLRGAKAIGKNIEFLITAGTGTNAQTAKIGDENMALLLSRALDDAAYYDPNAEKELAPDKKKYSEFEGQAIDWLLLRDEVMRTIDMLHERFQDGKLSLIEYEDKKAEILARL